VTLERVVGPEDDDRRADAALAAWLGESRGQVERWFAADGVTVDGSVVAKSRRLRAGERVRAEPPKAAAAAPQPPPVPVRYADPHLVVVAKPPGLVVHAGAGVEGEATLVDALRAQGVELADTGDPTRPGIVHRLDRGTSGLLVVASTPRAAAGLTEQLRARDVERRYWALVGGVPDPPRATIDAAIARSPARRTRFVVDAAGRPAVTHYDLVDDLGRAAVLEVRLETGRTHQVRVHLAAVGHPVCGDTAYGADRALAAELGLDRPALHARLLAFVHPVTGEQVRVEEALPADLAAALGRVRG
jgi:23S rRNA pseudouridine1911/1915/1917 synthase